MSQFQSFWFFSLLPSRQNMFWDGYTFELVPSAKEQFCLLIQFCIMFKLQNTSAWTTKDQQWVSPPPCNVMSDLFSSFAHWYFFSVVSCEMFHRGTTENKSKKKKCIDSDPPPLPPNIRWEMCFNGGPLFAGEDKRTEAWWQFRCWQPVLKLQPWSDWSDPLWVWLTLHMQKRSKPHVLCATAVQSYQKLVIKTNKQLFKVNYSPDNGLLSFYF